MASKCKNDNAGKLDMPKRNCEVLPLSVKQAQYSWLNKERKKLYIQFTKIYGKNKSSIHEIVKKEREIHASFVGYISNCKIYGHSAW
jgi:hypothetical protein